MRILAVEDEVNLLNQLERSLRDAGYVVDGAGDGGEGLYFGQEYDYDAAIIDLGLPLIRF